MTAPEPFEQYEVVRLIHRGESSVIREARARGAHGWKRRVALKSLLPDAGSERARRFLEQAKIASHLHHAGIVTVHDYGLVDGVPFQVLELVEGVDAGTLLRQGAPPIDLAVFIALEVAHALAYVHRACSDDGRPLGTQHGNVSPSSILLSAVGDVKLGGFGDARGPGASEIDADVRGLGVTLYELITGDTRAGQGGEVDLTRVPDDLRVILARSLGLAERWGHAEEMATALGRAFAARRVVNPRAQLASLVERIARPRDTDVIRETIVLDVARGADRTTPRAAPQRRAALFVTSALAVLIAGGVLIVVGHPRRRPPQASQEAGQDEVRPQEVEAAPLVDEVEDASTSDAERETKAPEMKPSPTKAVKVMETYCLHGKSYLCETPIARVCACWRDYSLLCPTEFIKGGQTCPNAATYQGDEGAPCVGMLDHNRGRAEGRLRCMTCDRWTTTGRPGEPCEGVDKSGAWKKGVRSAWGRPP